MKSINLKTAAACALALTLTIGGGAIWSSQQANAAETESADTAQTPQTTKTPQADQTAPTKDAKGKRGEGFGRGFCSEAAATALGMTQEELKAAHKEGKTLAAIAAEKGVALQTVIDAQLAEVKDRLAAELTAGTITQAQYDEKLAHAQERLTKAANGELPAHGHGQGKGGRKGSLKDKPQAGNTAAETSSTSA